MLVQYIDLAKGEFYTPQSLSGVHDDQILTHQFDALPFRVVKIRLDHQSSYTTSLIADVKTQLADMRLNVANASGSARQPDEIRLKSLCGLIAERLCMDLLNKYNRHRHAITISRDGSTGSINQIDLLLTKCWQDHLGQWRTLTQTVEVRASFPFKPIDKVVAKDFDILGAYTNSVKQTEIPKDWYVRFLYQLERKPEHKVYEHSPSGGRSIDYKATNTQDLQAYFDDQLMLIKDLTVYLVGGASGAMMHDDSIAYMGKMHSASFNQHAQAHYHKIKNHNALDALSLMQAMLSVITDEAKRQK